jgi:DNA-binding MarR family transcriptional regulator
MSKRKKHPLGGPTLVYKNTRDPKQIKERSEAVMEILKKGSVRPNDIRLELGVSHHTAIMAMKTLIKKGLVERRRHPKGLANYTYHLVDNPKS